MNTEYIEYTEYALFFVIVVFQIFFFIKTQKKIKEFKISIPNINDIKISDIELTDKEIETFVSTGLLNDIVEPSKDNKANFNNDGEDLEEEELMEDLYVSVELKRPPEIEKLNKIKIVISSKTKQSLVFSNILSSLNKYLVRNRHSTADFNLIKDIVERNTDTIEDEVNLTLSTPLYLGLMGTMLGIVIGLFSMSHLFNATIDDKALTSGIAVLLSSVKIAMIASFVGLAFTIYNSSLIFKGTKYKLEAKKNEFYTFIQVELLPSLNLGIGSTFKSLQRNLSKFNEKFDTNLDRLSNVFDKNYESLLLQKQLVQQLDRTKISEMTRYNVQVLKELNVALDQFGKFNALFDNVNKYVYNSFQLTTKTTELLARTDNFEKIANTIEENMSQNSHLLNFLSAHFTDLESHKQKVDEAIVDVSFGIKDTFSQLQNSIQISSQSLSEEASLRNLESQKVFDEFSDELKEAFINQAETVRLAMEDKVSNLDYLKHLEPLLAEVKSYRNSNSGSEKLYSELVELNTKISASNALLWQIEKDTQIPFFKKLFPKKRSNEG